MASFEMRLAILKGRLRAGSDSPELLGSVGLFVEDFEAFVAQRFCRWLARADPARGRVTTLVEMR